MSNLPHNWVDTTLGELSEYITSGSRDWSKYYSNEGALFIRTQDINKNRLGELDGIARVKLPNTTEGKRTLVKTYDLLVTITGANVGKCALIKNSLPEAYVSQSVALVRLIDKSLAPFLHRQLLAPDPEGKNFNTWLEENAYGMGRPVLSLENMRSVPIKLPPNSEQKRIADKLDAVLARVDACRDRLDRIPAILKRFRQSVLNVATSGKLTEEWRKGPDIENWKPHTLKDICISITDGDHQAPPQTEAGVPFITISAINDGKLKLEKASRFVPKTYFDNLKVDRKPQISDVLFSVTGSICIPAIVDIKAPFTFQRHIAILRPNQTIVKSSYLHIVLGSDSIRQQGINTATGTAQLTVPLTALRQFSLDLPPIDEQTEIVRRVETLFAYADRLEARYYAARAQVEKLTPALLAKAFRGELVPQDPNDEPARELLARVAAAQSTCKVKKARKPANTKNARVSS